jgi:hypothetical protein
MLPVLEDETWLLAMAVALSQVWCFAVFVDSHMFVCTIVWQSQESHSLPIYHILLGSVWQGASARSTNGIGRGCAVMRTAGVAVLTPVAACAKAYVLASRVFVVSAAMAGALCCLGARWTGIRKQQPAHVWCILHCPKVTVLGACYAFTCTCLCRTSPGMHAWSFVVAGACFSHVGRACAVLENS